MVMGPGSPCQMQHCPLLCACSQEDIGLPWSWALTWAHQAAATEHQLFPQPGPALFALSQPGLCFRDPRVPRGREGTGRWISRWGWGGWRCEAGGGDGGTGGGTGRWQR